MGNAGILHIAFMQMAKAVIAFAHRQNRLYTTKFAIHRNIAIFTERNQTINNIKKAFIRSD